MATTISIDDEIFEQLKTRAARESTSVHHLIEESLRTAIGTGDKPDVGKLFELVIFGKGGRFTSYEVDRTSTLMEQVDVERYGRSD